jgi:hypothetical protein
MRKPVHHRIQREDLPEKFVDLARRRTSYLFRLVTHQDLTILFASAYLQGASDAADAMANDALAPEQDK